MINKNPENELKIGALEIFVNEVLIFSKLKTGK
jgi:hypothetical protein